MSTQRASLFGDDDDLDVSGFAPRAAPDPTAPPAEAVRVVAGAAHFHSREAPREAPREASKEALGAAAGGAAGGHAVKRPPRRHRTGRNVQFNVKASQETVDAFYAISDRQGWVLGETLEHALAALRRSLDSGAGEG